MIQKLKKFLLYISQPLWLSLIPWIFYAAGASIYLIFYIIDHLHTYQSFAKILGTGWHHIIDINNEWLFGTISLSVLVFMGYLLAPLWIFSKKKDDHLALHCTLSVISGLMMLLGGRFNDQISYRNSIHIPLLFTIGLGIYRALQIRSVGMGMLYGALLLVFEFLGGEAIFKRQEWHTSYGFLGLALMIVPSMTETIYLGNIKREKINEVNKEVDEYFNDKILTEAASKWFDHKKLQAELAERNEIRRLALRISKVTMRKVDPKAKNSIKAEHNRTLTQLRQSKKLLIKYLRLIRSSLTSNAGGFHWIGEARPIDQLPGSKNSIKAAFKRIYSNEYERLDLVGTIDTRQERLNTLEAEFDSSYMALAYFVENEPSEDISLDEQMLLLQEWNFFKAGVKASKIDS